MRTDHSCGCPKISADVYDGHDVGIAVVNAPADNEPSSDGAASAPASPWVRRRWSQTGAKFEDLPRWGTWTFFTGPRDRSWVEIGASDHLPAELVSRQRSSVGPGELVCIA